MSLKRTFFAPQESLPGNAIRGYDVTLLGLGQLGIKKDMNSFQIPFKSSAFTAGGIVASAFDVSEFTLALCEGDVLNEPFCSGS